MHLFKIGSVFALLTVAVLATPTPDYPTSGGGYPHGNPPPPSGGGYPHGNPPPPPPSGGNPPPPPPGGGNPPPPPPPSGGGYPTGNPPPPPPAHSGYPTSSPPPPPPAPSGYPTCPPKGTCCTYKNKHTICCVSKKDGSEIDVPVTPEIVKALGW